MRTFASMAVVLGLAAAALGAAPVGEVVFRADFEGNTALRGWSGGDGKHVRLGPGPKGSHGLVVEQPAGEGAGSRTVKAALPLDRVRGTRLRFEVTAKADGVAKPPQVYNGVKCMLHTVSPSGSRWSQENNVFGTFDARKLRFVAEVPADATEAWVVLGLEATTGTVTFDDLAVTVVGRRRRAPEAKPAGAAFTGHAVPRLRGAMISPNVTAEDLRVLGGWGANHVRWQLLWGGFPHSPADKGDLPAYDRWLDGALDHLAKLLPVCRETGMLVLIDLHTPPGGRNEASECRLFHERRFQDHFVSVWEKIVRRFKDEPAVWGYDLVNEPVEGAVGQGLLDWHALATRTAKRVREMDAKKAIVIEPAPWGDPDALEWFDPLDVPGVVYSVHMYKPHKFTHQGVYDQATGLAYPGVIEGRPVGKEQLRAYLQPARDYQRDYGVAVYLGEFSAIRWAPGESALNYLRDVIDLAEEYGWDWAYHAFREWDGWSVEHGPDKADRKRAAAPTARERLLRAWFGKNERAR